MAGGSDSEAAYDRASELKSFDDSKAGVKGLVDAGITRIPRIFVHAPEDLPKPSDAAPSGLRVPVIDIGLATDSLTQRTDVVEEVRAAAETWGFFQVVNHGVPEKVLDGALEGIRRFHEGETDEKAKLFSCDTARKVRFVSNFYLYEPKAATWRDTLTLQFDGTLNADDIPQICRDAIMAYRKHVLTVTERLCELLSEALGLNPERLGRIKCAETQVMLLQYYPACPEPELTLGTVKHADPSFFTVLLQDGLGGLQVHHEGCWVDLQPIHGALVVNIGDLLQLVSNDRFRSAHHRVLANRRGPRISTAMFFSPRITEQMPYGPMKELLSDETPPVYRELLMYEYMRHYISKGATDTALSHFKLR